MPTLTFTDDQIEAANQEWGLNCGPAALAFACQTSLEAVRYALPEFPAHGYTNPTMMKAGLANLCRGFTAVATGRGRALADSRCIMFAGPMTLVRIQWTGPWTEGDRLAKWSSKHTHWIATWAERGVWLVYDINGGIQHASTWEDTVVPAITATIPRADGGWYPANIWRLSPRRE